MKDITFRKANTALTNNIDFSKSFFILKTEVLHKVIWYLAAFCNALLPYKLCRNPQASINAQEI